MYSHNPLAHLVVFFSSCRCCNGGVKEPFYHIRPHLGGGVYLYDSQLVVILAQELYSVGWPHNTLDYIACLACKTCNWSCQTFTMITPYLDDFTSCGCSCPGVALSSMDYDWHPEFDIALMLPTAITQCFPIAGCATKNLYHRLQPHILWLPSHWVVPSIYFDHFILPWFDSEVVHVTVSLWSYPLSFNLHMSGLSTTLQFLQLTLASGGLPLLKVVLSRLSYQPLEAKQATSVWFFHHIVGTNRWLNWLS